jgi:hypothetical protein
MSPIPLAISTKCGFRRLRCLERDGAALTRAKGAASIPCTMHVFVFLHSLCSTRVEGLGDTGDVKAVAGRAGPNARAQVAPRRGPGHGRHCDPPSHESKHTSASAPSRGRDPPLIAPGSWSRSRLRLLAKAGHRCRRSRLYLVGYDDPTAFHKALKRWTGNTPTEHRSRPRGGMGLARHPRPSDAMDRDADARGRVLGDPGVVPQSRGRRLSVVHRGGEVLRGVLVGSMGAKVNA